MKEKMVGITGIEPVTSSMSTKRSPAELYTRNKIGSVIPTKTVSKEQGFCALFKFLFS